VNGEAVSAPQENLAACRNFDGLLCRIAQKNENIRVLSVSNFFRVFRAFRGR